MAAPARPPRSNSSSRSDPTRLDPDRPFTTHEVASLLGVTIPTVVEWIRRGHLVGYQTPGGHRRIRVEELHRFAVRIGAELALPAPALRPPRVLLITADPEGARPLAEDLREDGCEVRVTAGGYDAGWLLGHFQPQLVVIDEVLGRPAPDEVREALAHHRDPGAGTLVRAAGDDHRAIRTQVQRALLGSARLARD